MSTEDQKQLEKTVNKMSETIETISKKMQAAHIADYVLLMNSPRKLFTRSIIAGLGRGVGIAIGFTLITVALLYFLRVLGALDLPIIGDYIADIVEIVQNQLQMRSY